jgi:hypothetical protein
MIGKSGNLEGGIEVLQEVEKELHRLAAYVEERIPIPSPAIVKS